VKPGPPPFFFLFTAGKTCWRRWPTGWRRWPTEEEMAGYQNLMVGWENLMAGRRQGEAINGWLGGLGEADGWL